WKPLAALLAFIVGAGIAFLAAQPARAEERNNETLRRLVYGANISVTVLLLLLLLIAGNVIATAKIPNKLDTTETGFYTLQPSTEKFLRTLDQKVTVYTILPESGPPYSDIRRMLAVCQEVNPERFIVKPMTISNRNEVRTLKAKFPTADLDSDGVIVAVGDETRNGFIRAMDFVKSDGGGVRGGGRELFQGEARLMKELVFLAENKAKPVVYFTQGHGELAIAPLPTQPVLPERSLAIVKGFLEKQNIECRPLTFAPGQAMLPADANIVVVADPRSTLPKEVVDVLRQHIQDPKPNGEKGKLLILTSAHPSATKTDVMPTGLEELMGSYGVNIAPAYVYSQPTDRLPPGYSIMTWTGAASMARLPMAMTLQDAPILAPYCRPIEVGQVGPQVPLKPMSLLETYPGQISWLESTKLVDVMPTWREIVKNFNGRNQEALAKKGVSNTRSIGAVITEGDTGRVVVYGCGTLFADDVARQLGESNLPGQVLAITIDYLRERKEVPEVVAKPFEFYSLKPNYDGTRLFTLPLVLAMLALAGIGTGVWVVRRK
ncbi:MAG: Gldg family protein, partial [Gemmataceae bacterium]